MGTKRVIINRGRSGHLRPEVVAAWMAGDVEALHIALRLRPWEPSPLPCEIAGPLGCDEHDSPPNDPEDQRSLAQSLAWQRKLLTTVGWPDCRSVYEENLKEAEQSLEYARKRFEHLPAGEIGTGTDLESRRQRMLEAEAEVTYCRALLAAFEAVRAEWMPKNTSLLEALEKKHGKNHPLF
jgi:hypothetical protein